MSLNSATSFTYILKSISIVYQSSPKWTFINTFVTIIRGFIPLLLLYVVKQLIDIVENYSTNTIIDHSMLYFTIAAAGLFFLLNSLTGSINSLVRERQAHFVNDYVQNLIHQKTVNISFSYFEDANYQNIFYRALSDATFRPGRIFYSILQMFQYILTLGLIMLVLTQVHWAMIPILLIAGLPIVFFRVHYSKKLYQYRKEHTEDERKMHYYNRLLTAKDFAKELRVFDLSKVYKIKYEKVKNKLRNKQWKLAKTKTIWEASVQIISTLVLLSIIGFVIAEAIDGRISNGSMAMYFLALQRGYGVLQTFLTSLTSLYEDNLFLKNFFEFQKIETPTNQIVSQKFPQPLQQGIILKNVNFKYPNSTKWILKDINLIIPKGKTVALVGKNGCGKTTLVKLLAGLYTPSEGSIFVDNTNWHNINNTELANNVSIIFQDFMLYNVAARDNIRFGNTRREGGIEEVKLAAAKAGIDHLFSNLDNGYDTTLGTLFKDSQMLSRGEWQRTALARSFYNTDAQLIILDEPTSSLDAFTEANLISHFKEITKDKTAVIVSHRLSTIKLADIIVVISDSGIAETGTPHELISKKGVYYEMIESLK